ncbi:MAG: EamA family transporter RarD [Treponema sp.]|jgi:chloramphenicol-sensitive protein RarD|nr:EamA family transporter RarD [Treponema sp.]
MDKPSRGIFFAVLAYVLWGILPLYWKLLASVNSLHILGFRILFSLLLTSAVLFPLKKISWLRIFKDRRKSVLLSLAAFALSANWGLYIWAVNSGHTIETSVGYYLNPLISIVLGLCFFREKLKPPQWAAFGLAMAGVAVITVSSGAPPWISLSLALTFGFYGLIKKTVNLSALESLGAETLIASPLGLALLFLVPGTGGLTGLPVSTLALLLLCGAVTTLPLYFFAKGTKLLPLSTMGFIQFISPTLTFLEGVFIFKESFPPRKLLAFGCIWAAVILYIVSLKKGNDRRL